MSHFSTIKTKIKEKPQLIEALNLLGETPNVPFAGCSTVELVITNPSHAENHPTKEVDVSIGVDIGFKLNEKTGEYELIADRQTWKKDIPIERFLEKLTQQYARLTVHEAIEEQGFQLAEDCLLYTSPSPRDRG